MLHLSFRVSEEDRAVRLPEEHRRQSGPQSIIVEAGRTSSSFLDTAVGLHGNRVPATRASLIPAG
jgi:hypothetical protein